MNVIEIDVQGKKQKLFIEKVNGNWWVHFDGETELVESLSSTQRKASDSSSMDVKEIIAPMPGKITKVLITAGQKVKRHDVLVVMEAMKMEYALSAPRDTVVAEVHAKAGVQVGVHTVLVRFKDEK